jgi:hypothetical protein
MARPYPKCPECGALIDGEVDEEGWATYGDCPNTCPQCHAHPWECECPKETDDDDEAA